MNCFYLGDVFENCSLYIICLWLCELCLLSLSWVSALIWPLCISNWWLILLLNNSILDSISLSIQTTQRSLEWPFFFQSSHLVCCSASICGVFQIFINNFHAPDINLYFLPGLFFILLVFFFPSISAYPTYIATRLNFLYWIYMSLSSLKFCDAISLIELHIKLLAWHLKLFPFCLLWIPDSSPSPCIPDLFLMVAVEWLFCCLDLCCVF